MASTESVAESATIEALGSLFKITEVFLWDDGMGTIPDASVHLHNVIEEEPAISCATADTNSGINHTDEDSSFNGSCVMSFTDYTSVEDFGLAKQMDALGLPISFSTSKKKNNVAAKTTKRKGIQEKSVSTNKDIEYRVLVATRSCLSEDNSSSRVLHDSTNIPFCDIVKATEATTGDTYHDDYRDRCRGSVDRESVNTTASILSDIIEKQVGDDETPVIMRSCIQHELSCFDIEMETSTEVLELSSGPENFHGNDHEYVKSGAHKEELFQKNVLDNYVECPATSCCIIGDTHDDNKNLNSCPTTIESSCSGASAGHHFAECPDNFPCYEFGDWRVIWDSFYKRNYFYNFQSQESTWYPPPGLEHFALCSNIPNSSDLSSDEAEEHPEIISCRMNGDITACSDGHEIVKETADKHVLLHTPPNHSTDELDVDEYQEKQENCMNSETCSVLDMAFELTVGNSWVDTENEGANGENGGDFPSIGLTSMYELDGYHEVCGKKKKKKKKKRERKLQSRLTLQEVDGFVPANIVKYWCQRYLLFSRFDDGIKMDEEGWFSVTPESIAKHHASRCNSGIIIDGFTGVGGNTIQFAMKGNYVIAVDIDSQKIDCAQDNAAIYGVSDKINFIQGDFFQIAPRLKGDVIFLSPPWGGPNYSKVQSYDIRTMLKPHDGKHLFDIARTIASKVVMFLPRNVDLHQLAELSLSVNPPWTLEVEKNFLNGKLKAITAYFDNPT
ncbi:uncharacterized protein LOC109850335 isoform X2 [Asparagus officinalis]|uniref:uncharacterized protein LOC109850335 isoform X2 n=1 Tax=Asparagus officinalis TaxID=4686 RepID=UPI00098E3408|nr:uncharacterized protein LOC109850335 isoform X2 [Asparagus officinalis]